MAAQLDDLLHPAAQKGRSLAQTGRGGKPRRGHGGEAVYDLEGNAHTLSEFRGKPVVLNFWASWCGPCKSEMPDFQEKYEAYGNEIQFLMVNLTDGSQETVETAQGYVEGQGYTFPVYFDTAYSAAIAYAVNAVPATYFINENGTMVAYGKGAMSGETLQRGIDMLLS